jgi:hypothetical protein
MTGAERKVRARVVIVADGAAAVEKNPTLTILALASRSSDYLAGEMKAGRL